jgi:hypothetical protein
MKPAELYDLLLHVFGSSVGDGIGCVRPVFETS